MVLPLGQNDEGNTLNSDISTWPKGPARSDRNVDRLANLIRNRILEGELPPGTLLPAERVLANHLGVSRNTLRSAMARIESEGLLVIRQGRGVMVQDYRSVGNLSLVENMPAEMQNALLPEILELRRTLAVKAAVKACVKGTEEDLDELAELANRLSGCDDLEQLFTMDMAFSRKLVRAAKSVTLELLLNSVSALLSRRPDIAEAIFHDREDVRASYAIIVELIRSRDAQVVGELFRAGLELRDQRTLELLHMDPRSPAA